jgi:hypothetical protein
MPQTPTGNSFEDRLNHTLDRAEREYRDKIWKEESSDPFGLPWQWTPESEAARLAGGRRAALEFFGAILLFFIAEYSSEPISDAELCRRVGVFTAGLRETVLENKWPMPRPIVRDWEIEAARQFDDALIRWLESQPEWKQYEARTVPRTPVDDTENEPHLIAAGPPFDLPDWSSTGFSVQARSRVQAGLLEIHGDFLDDKIAGGAECWRRAYDLIAEQFAAAGRLSEETINIAIPAVVADACAAFGWFEDGWGQVRPTGIFSERLGSQFYPLWRSSAFREALGGRIAHWRGRLFLGHTTEHDGLPSGEPSHSGPSREEPSRALKAHRREILKAYITDNTLGGMDGLARRAGTTTTALYGMVRGDRTRYSPEKLDNLLKIIGCSQEEW